MVPFVLLSFAIATLMVCGGITASAGFLAQRDVQSVCDGAAVAAANALDEDGYFGVGTVDVVPLSEASVTAAVREHLAAGDAGLDAWSASTDGRSVEITCTRFVRLPFATIFLGGASIERTARSAARSPLQP